MTKNKKAFIRLALGVADSLLTFVAIRAAWNDGYQSALIDLKEQFDTEDRSGGEIVRDAFEEAGLI